MYDENNRNENDAIIEAARLSTEPTILAPGSIYAVPTANGDLTTIDLDTNEHRRRSQPAPDRKTGAVHFTEHQSLAAYVNGHKADDATTLWANRDKGTIVAVLNDHSTLATAGWADHRATLTLEQSPSWKAWSQANGRLFEQVAFADFIEDHLIDIVDPTGAHLLEVAQSIQATKNVVMKSATRLDNGEVKLRYEEQLDAKAGQQGDLTIPARLTLGVAPFEGMDLYRVEARLRFRLSNGSVSFSIHLDRPEDVLRSAFAFVAESVAAETGLTVFYGTPRN
jgi:uncharacterized protein YfdQ (DUF2303 family)